MKYQQQNEFTLTTIPTHQELCPKKSQSSSLPLSLSSSSLPSPMILPTKIEQLKQKEALLLRLLEETRNEKINALKSNPLKIGIVGFGRFGQFIAKTFAKHGQVVATSRSDYTDVANAMGVKYVPLHDIQAFLNENLDVIVLATSIVSFEQTVRSLAPELREYIQRQSALASSSSCAPMIVDVLSVKEHPREIMLDLLPKECDILCTHPMFGPDSGKNGWDGLRFVYERTRVDGIILGQTSTINTSRSGSRNQESSFDINDDIMSDEDTIATTLTASSSFFIEDEDTSSPSCPQQQDRMERFLSIWEEEGCNMVELSCKDHDSHAANSQFVTHLLGRIMDEQGLEPTPIDTKGFESVRKLVSTTAADSFDLFYGLYKYNRYSKDIIGKVQVSMDKVVKKIEQMELRDKAEKKTL